MILSKLCRVSRCPNPPSRKGYCQRHRSVPDRVCKCGKAKDVRSKQCVGCYHAHRAERQSNREVCACGKPKHVTSQKCRSCRNEERATLRCECGARVSSTQSRTCLPCRMKAPTKIPKKRLDYMREWRKLNPKGPPCSRCGERLSQRSRARTIPPLCMTCRAETGQLSRGLRRYPSRDSEAVLDNSG